MRKIKHTDVDHAHIAHDNRTSCAYLYDQVQAVFVILGVSYPAPIPFPHLWFLGEAIHSLHPRSSACRTRIVANHSVSSLSRSRLDFQPLL